MAVESWWRLTVRLKNGAALMVMNGEAETRNAAHRLQKGRITDEWVEVSGWIATPLIVAVRHHIDPSAIVAITVQDCPQFVYAERPDDIESML